MKDTPDLNETVKTGSQLTLKSILVILKVVHFA